MLKFLLAESGGTGSIVVYVVLIVALIFILVMPFFTQRKKNKQYAEMLNSIRVGDLVKTVGGVIGKVTKIIDKGEIKTVILETGSKSEKSYLEFDITTIYCVLKSSKAPEEETETAEETKSEAALDAKEPAETAPEIAPEVKETTPEAKETAPEEKQEKAEPKPRKKKTSTAKKN